MTAYIYLFGRVGCNGICSGQVDKFETITSLFECAGLGIYGDAAVIAYMLATACQYVEK